MIRRDIIAVGASAGGIRALRTLLQDLPPDLPAAMLVTVHLNPSANEDAVARAIQGSALLPVAVAREGDEVVSGRVFLAPPDRHLIVDGSRLLVRRGPMENSSRPAIDPMLRSVACSFRGRAIGVLLTGYLDDGVSGLIAVKRCGGLVVVQDPEDAEYPDMPRHAVERAAPDHITRLNGLPRLLCEAIARSAGPMVPAPRDLALEVQIAARHGCGMGPGGETGELSALTCPECHGSMREIRDGGSVRYRCHTGHAYSLESLAHSQDHEVERALVSALRALEERARMLQRMSRDTMSGGRDRIAARFAGQAREYDEQAALIRKTLVDRAPPSDDAPRERTAAAPTVPTVPAALHGGHER